MNQYLYRSYVENVEAVTPELFFDLPVMHAFKLKPMILKRTVVSDVLISIDYYATYEDLIYSNLIMSDAFTYVLDGLDVVEEKRTRKRYYEDGTSGETRLYITNSEYS